MGDYYSKDDLSEGEAYRASMVVEHFREIRTTERMGDLE